MRVVLLLLALLASTAQAHRPSDAFLTLNVENSRISGHWEIALNDLEVAQGVDANRDSVLTWGELQAARRQLDESLATALTLRSDDAACPVQVTDLLINDRLDGRYAWFELQAQCPHTVGTLEVEYQFLFDLDPSHRGIVVLHSGDASETRVLSPSEPQLRFTPGTSSGWHTVRDYAMEGVHHIWIGIDHILFLLALLLPAVLLREGSQWRPVPALRPALWSIFGVVTAFTLAHSITLTLAALEVLSMPSRWVESAIAASVVLAALNNLWPVVNRARWAMAFAFGLIHGFGFASVLGELGLPPASRLLALVAFNIGVELGQLAIVLVAMPLAYWLRTSRFYRLGVLTAGSAAVVVIGLGWFYQRAVLG